MAFLDVLEIVSLVQAIKGLWPIKINTYSEIWGTNVYEQDCIYIYIDIYMYIYMYIYVYIYIHILGAVAQCLSQGLPI